MPASSTPPATLPPPTPAAPAAPAVTPAVTPNDGAGLLDVTTANGHLSESMEKERWLRLLIVLAAFLLLMAAVGVVMRLLGYIGHTLLLFSLGGLLAYALDPLVEKISRPGTTTERKRPRWVGVVIVFGGIGLIVLGGSVLLSHEFGRQVHALAEHHVELQARAHERLADLQDWLQSRGLNVNLEQYVSHPSDGAKTWGQGVAKGVVQGVERFSASLVEAVIVLLIALYFLIYSNEMRRGMLRALPPRFQPYAEQWRNDLNRILGGFVRGQLILALVIGASAAVGCLVLGIGQWLIIGLIVVVAALIPVFGPYIGAIPAVIAALITPQHHGLLHLPPVARAVAVLLLFAVINEVGSKVLYPRLVGAALGLHEVLVLFALFAGWEVGHLWGVLFAAPLTALVGITVAQLYRLWEGLPPISLAQEALQGGAKARTDGTP